MATARDSDISLWLHNKLGTSNDSWISGSIISQLNKEVLRNIKECFSDLQTQVKLKLLLSFFHIPRRIVEEVKKKSSSKSAAAAEALLWGARTHTLSLRENIPRAYVRIVCLCVCVRMICYCFSVWGFGNRFC